MQQPVIYFDMDGVLNFFDEIVPREVVLAPGGHYLAHRPPDPRAIRLMKDLSESVDTLVLTRLFNFLPNELKLEQTEDKKVWCRNNLDSFDLRNRFLCTDGSKEDVLAGIPAGNRACHILIDDDPDVLRGWETAGGTGVQYRQPGRTMARHAGFVIGPKDEDPYDIMMDVLDAIQTRTGKEA